MAGADEYFLTSRTASIKEKEKTLLLAFNIKLLLTWKAVLEKLNWLLNNGLSAMGFLCLFFYYSWRVPYSKEMLCKWMLVGTFDWTGFFFCTLHLGLIIIVLSLISSYTVNCYPSFFLSLIGWVKSNLLIVAYRSSLIPINSMKLELTVLAFYYIIPSILSNYYGNYWNNIKLFKAILLK